MNPFSNLTWSAILSTAGSLLWLVAKALLVLLAGLLLTKWLLRFSKSCLSRSRINVTLHTFILSCVKIVCYVFLIVIALSMLVTIEAVI